jgi:NAD-dependent SIR2 family protein deacetylase
MVGWVGVDRARPNAAHYALADLERAGKIDLLITQNVDRLHQKAGSQHVVDLHGRLDQVICLNCGEQESRQSFQARLLQANPFVGDLHTPCTARR